VPPRQGVMMTRKERQQRAQQRACAYSARQIRRRKMRAPAPPPAVRDGRQASRRRAARYPRIQRRDDALSSSALSVTVQIASNALPPYCFRVSMLIRVLSTRYVPRCWRSADGELCPARAPRARYARLIKRGAPCTRNDSVILCPSSRVFRAYDNQRGCLFCADARRRTMR